MTKEQDKESRLVIEKLARGESVEWQWGTDNNRSNNMCWYDPTEAILKYACDWFSRGVPLRLKKDTKPPAKSIYQIAFGEGNTVQWFDPIRQKWFTLKETTGIKDSSKHKWRILEPDQYAPWREKQKRGEKFEYKCPKLCEDWAGGENCLFLKGIEYEFRDFIPHREWKERYDKGISIQLRTRKIDQDNWSDWYTVTCCAWPRFIVGYIYEFRDAPVKEPLRYVCSECGVTIIQGQEHGYPVNGGTHYKCEKCFNKKEPVPLGPEDVFIGQMLLASSNSAGWIVDKNVAMVQIVSLHPNPAWITWTELQHHYKRLVNKELLPCEK